MKRKKKHGPDSRMVMLETTSEEMMGIRDRAKQLGMTMNEYFSFLIEKDKGDDSSD